MVFRNSFVCQLFSVMWCPMGYIFLCLLIRLNWYNSTIQVSSYPDALGKHLRSNCISISGTSQAYYHLGKVYYYLVHLEQERFALHKNLCIFCLFFQQIYDISIVLSVFCIYLYVAKPAMFSDVLLFVDVAQFPPVQKNSTTNFSSWNYSGRVNNSSI